MLVKRTDKNVKSISNKIENLVDISDCKDFENFKFVEEKKKKEEKKKESVIEYEESKE